MPSTHREPERLGSLWHSRRDDSRLSFGRVSRDEQNWPERKKSLFHLEIGNYLSCFTYIPMCRQPPHSAFSSASHLRQRLPQRKRERRKRDSRGGIHFRRACISSHEHPPPKKKKSCTHNARQLLFLFISFFECVADSGPTTEISSWSAKKEVMVAPKKVILLIEA